jgi:hypothetical protein
MSWPILIELVGGPWDGTRLFAKPYKYRDGFVIEYYEFVGTRDRSEAAVGSIEEL